MEVELKKIEDIEIKIEKKRIKNIHLAVYPPDGRVRCSVPFQIGSSEIESFLKSRVNWIKEKRQDVIDKAGSSIRNFETGETHYLFGKPYFLKILPTREMSRVEIKESTMEMHIYPGMKKGERAGFLLGYYKRRLERKIEEMAGIWLERMGEKQKPLIMEVESMKRQWGKCYPFKRRILLNLMLARVPLVCVEYVLVHELVHLKVHGHGRDFKAKMDEYLPDWRIRKKLLNSFPSLII